MMPEQATNPISPLKWPSSFNKHLDILRVLLETEPGSLIRAKNML